MALHRQPATLPPPQPSFILRGHASQVHSVRFVRQNRRFISGDADGWVVYWKLETRRPRAVWKAHDGAILRTEQWRRDRVITHGRDNSLRIWQLRACDESTLSTILPAEDPTTPRPKPWLLYTLPVNTLNFCAFSMCPENASFSSPSPCSAAASQDAILIATPSTDDKQINIYHYPDEKLRYVVPKVVTTDTGMVMAVKLVHDPPSQSILVLSGYEGGLTAVHQLPPNNASSTQSAQLVYLSQPHTQPVLSLDVSVDARTYFTSSADSILAAHRIPDIHVETVASSTSSHVITAEKTETSDLDHTISNVAPLPDGVNDASTVSADTTWTAPLSFSKQPVKPPSANTSKAAGLSSLLSSSKPPTKAESSPAKPRATIVQAAYKATNTKHCGQQSLCVRSDGRIMATGGWDSRVRIYSAKTLKEIAVLKWHKEGVYAVDIAKILQDGDLRRHDSDSDSDSDNNAGDDDMVARRETGLGRLQKQREEAMQRKHYIAAGAKDGKISLWEVF
ncbi:Astra associated protein 1 Asa1 [Pleosporales sp. CAS-2024a]